VDEEEIIRQPVDGRYEGSTHRHDPGDPAQEPPGWSERPGPTSEPPPANTIDREQERERRQGPIEEYAHGEIRAYHGIVNKWLLVVYAILAVWGIYYLFTYWGGLGPGLAR